MSSKYPYVSFDKLYAIKEFYGEINRDLIESEKKDILQAGFKDPFTVIENSSGNFLVTSNFSRYLALKELSDEGHEIWPVPIERRIYPRGSASTLIAGS